MASDEETNDGKKSRLETLKQQKAKITARIEEMERLENAKSRKRDTRLKVLVGASCLADAAIHDDIRATVRTVLARAVKAPRDREFLKSAGWL